MYANQSAIDPDFSQIISTTKFYHGKDRLSNWLVVEMRSQERRKGYEVIRLA